MVSFWAAFFLLSERATHALYDDTKHMSIPPILGVKGAPESVCVWRAIFSVWSCVFSPSLARATHSFRALLHPSGVSQLQLDGTVVKLVFCAIRRCYSRLCTCKNSLGRTRAPETFFSQHFCVFSPSFIFSRAYGVFFGGFLSLVRKSNSCAFRRHQTHVYPSNIRGEKSSRTWACGERIYPEFSFLSLPRAHQSLISSLITARRCFPAKRRLYRRKGHLLRYPFVSSSSIYV